MEHGSWFEFGLGDSGPIGRCGARPLNIAVLGLSYFVLACPFQGSTKLFQYNMFHTLFIFLLSMVGIGYNGFPRGCSDDQLPWAKVGESKRIWVFFGLSIKHSHRYIYLYFRNQRPGILWKLSTRECFFKSSLTLVVTLIMFLLIMLFYLFSVSIFSYVCHAEVNAILNTNHASAAGQVSSPALSNELIFDCHISLKTPQLASG